MKPTPTQIEAAAKAGWEAVEIKPWDDASKDMKSLARNFARAALSVQPAAEVVGEPAWWIVTTDMGKVIFHGPDKERADRVAAIHGREAQPLYAATCDDTAIRAHLHLIRCFADEINERNWADKALYIKQQAERVMTEIDAAPSAPDGWQLVPVTPTPEMVTDGRIAGHAVDACKYIKDYGDLFRSQWERALRAAPTPPQPIGAQDWRRNCQYLLDVLDGQGFASSDLSEEDDDAISFIRASLGEATKEV